MHLIGMQLQAIERKPLTKLSFLITYLYSEVRIGQNANKSVCMSQHSVKQQDD